MPNKGELKVISVSRLNYLISHCLSINYPLIKVEGEISQILVSKAKHMYFTLKDEHSCVRCVFFNVDPELLSFNPEDGNQVVVEASPSIYKARGDFQLKVLKIAKSGSGKLFERFLLLSKKLKSEGLFEPENKKEIPSFIESIGIITSLDAAALRDAIITINNIIPRIRVKIFASLVQGDKAPEELIKAINLAESDDDLDVLLLIRGGGSLEDLWAFNNENLIRNLAKVSKPIITGIGHETDTTLSDLVADYRAATPTAAVEIIGVQEQKLIHKFNENRTRLRKTFIDFIRVQEQKFDLLSIKIKSPRDELILKDNNFKHAYLRLIEIKKNLFNTLKYRIDQTERRLSALNPLAILKRGYCVLYKKNYSEVITSINQIVESDQLDVKLFDGNASVLVKNIKKLNK
ncbi:MAG: exodeoxyribonuclease VII large subunit [Betaproteobacteria bacterium TMED156]|nr:MAG: exodeoxyribonuclease VII large subunit [Betaproteobacteria bacterium TMED156]